MRKSILILIAGIIASACWAKPNTPKEPRRGVVVLTVSKGSGAAIAGIQPGDILETSSRAGTMRNLESPFDLTWVQQNQSPLGQIQLKGRRGNQRRTWLLPPILIGAKVRPVLPPGLLRAFAGAQQSSDSGKFFESGSRLLKIAREASPADSRFIKPWLFSFAAEAFANARLWEDADRAYADAVAAAESSPDVKTSLLEGWGDALIKRQQWVEAERRFGEALAEKQKHATESIGIGLTTAQIGACAWSRGDLDKAQQYLETALAMERKLAPESDAVAAVARRLGVVFGRRGDQRTAVKHFESALAIWKRLHPESLEVATVLDDLAVAAARRGDLVTGESYERQALALTESIAPDSSLLAAQFNNLGAILRNRGDLSGAEEYLKKALGLKDKWNNSVGVGLALMNLGTIARRRGDLEKAEKYINQSLALQESQRPDSLDVADCLLNLGNVLTDRFDLDAAERALVRALAIREKIAPGSSDIGLLLQSLGNVAYRQDRLETAESYHRRSLAIFEKAQASLDVANAAVNLGGVAARRNQLEESEGFYRRALELRQRLAPNSLLVAESLSTMGLVAEQRGNLEAAEDFERQALDLSQKLAPDTTEEAHSLHILGKVMRRRGELQKASGFFCRAATVLERQADKLGGTQDTKALFRANSANYYQDCLESLVATNHPAEAFGVLERSRARSLLNLLAERDLNFADDAPAELLRKRKLNAVDYDRIQAQIGNLNPGTDSARIESLMAKMRELNTQRQEISTAIREASPRLASLQSPHPLDLAGVQKALDPGTVLLAYSVGESETILFAVRPAGTEQDFTVYRLQTGGKELRRRVQAFRNLMERQSSNLDKPAAELYELLLRPAEAAIGKSDRILIVPDGALHALPFSALRRDGHFLVEWKPLWSSVSASVYAELKKTPIVGHQPAKLVAFGDPQYPDIGDSTAGTGSEGVRKRGFALEPLPASRAEVQKIGDLYSQTNSRVYLGADVTEERVKSLGRDVSYLHFATHALLDEQFPLNSALVLSIPKEGSDGRENGLLQAWEIFEQLRIDADLVTLSACETGLGQELGGEGLIGLTRAFQYAGARSILASLWSVADASTADLMERFYRHLQSGQSKAEALQAAQLEEIANPQNSHPFHWASFSLIGDWTSRH